MSTNSRREGEGKGELTETVPVIAQGLAAVEVLDLEVEKAPVTYNPILGYFNNTGLGVKAGV